MKRMDVRHGAGLVLAGMLASSCGMDDMSSGIDGTGALTYRDIVSSGRVRVQGVVEVNGIRFDVAGVNVQIDDQTGTASQLKDGDIVLVEGRVGEGTSSGVARTVTSEHVLLGEVDSVDVQRARFVALGQTVQVTNDTAWDTTFAQSLTSLSPGDAISVSGFRATGGEIVATRVDRQMNGRVSFRTTGAVKEVSHADRRLTIGGLIVDFGAIPGIPAATVDAIVARAFVEVEGLRPQAGVLIANRLEVKAKRLPGPAGRLAYLEGYLTGIDPEDPTIFELSGLPVTTSTTTSVEGQLAQSSLLRARGALDGAGAVAATEIRLPGGFVIPGPVLQIEGRVFDPVSGPISGASIHVWVATPRAQYVYGWAVGALESGVDGRFSMSVSQDSRLRVRANKPGYRQPCAVFADASAVTSFGVELIPESRLDPANPERSLWAFLPPGAPTISGTVYEMTSSGRQPIEGVWMWLDGAMGDGMLVNQVHTDREGRYMTCNAAAGSRLTLVLLAVKPGYEMKSVWPIQDGVSEVFDIEMKRQ